MPDWMFASNVTYGAVVSAVTVMVILKLFHQGSLSPNRQDL
jgi:hypothetical protein